MVLANQNNKLIRKSILSMFPGSLAAMVTVSVAMMADTILAGAIFDKYAIAAVAVGMPIINIFQALTQTIINGSSIKMNVSAGKGENDEVNKSYASSIVKPSGKEGSPPYKELFISAIMPLSVLFNIIDFLSLYLH